NFATVGPYVFYGANDGALRAIKGGRDGTTDGKESWSFVPPEFYGKFLRQRSQTPALQLPTVLGANTNKDYFFDGPIGSFQDATRAWIFVTARRGGRFIYAFDVSDPTSPRFMWKKSSADANMSELGQTWSEPKAVKVKAFADPVLIFGAGYDPNEDKTPASAATMGRGVFVLNARTGDYITLFNTSVNGGGGVTNAVPSDVAIIDRDFDTFADRAYVGDTGGNIWRMDIDDPDYTKWKMEKLASLGTLKFLYRPDVIPTKNFDIVLAGTGDREKPLVTTSTDYFFMLKDIATGKDGSALVPLGFADLVANGTQADPAKGWYLALAPGEKVVNAPLTIGGITFFATNKPTPPPNDDSPQSCQANLGEARAYAVDFLTGGAGIDRNGDGSKNSSDISVVLAGGGLPPSAVGGTLQLDDGTTTPFCIGCGSTRKPPEAEKPPVTIPKIRRKLYWNTGTDK
ncbi:MAG: pilus assembly protein, partial [Betaproteobacteria bacterium]